MTGAAISYPDFLSGGLLAAEDFSAEQDAQLSSQQAYNLGRRTAGVVKGLFVEATPDMTSVQIGPGIALNPLGQTMLIADPVQLSMASQVAQQAEIMLRLTRSESDWRLFDGSSGNTRINETAEVFILPAGGGRVPGAICLASVTIDPGQIVKRVSYGRRQLSGLTLGTLEFPRPGLTEKRRLRIEPMNGGKTALITASRTDFFGALTVQGRLSVGDRAGEAAQADLEVDLPREICGASVISNADNNWYAEETGAFSMITPGDRLFIGDRFRQAPPFANQTLMSTPPPVPHAKDPAPFDVTEVLSSAELYTRQSPQMHQSRAPYGFQMGTALRVVVEESITALAIQSDARVGVGTAQPDQALTVAGGDIRIEADGALQFQGAGAVTAAGGGCRIGSSGPQDILTIGSDKEVACYITSVPPNGDPDMVITQDQHVGLGTSAPHYALSVNGEVRASEGLVFPDGTIQTETAVPIPVGAIVDLWKPLDDANLRKIGFQICDGSKITDPDSPFKGSNTPDLNHRFARGVSKLDEIGLTGGADMHQHKYSIAEHTHPMPHTHAVQGTLRHASERASTSLPDVVKKALPKKVDALLGKGADHTHTHRIDGDSGAPSVPDTGIAVGMKGSAETDEASSMPLYMMSLKVMRVK